MAEPHFPPPRHEDPRSLYLDLMKRSLTNWLYADREVRPLKNRGWKGAVRRALVRLMAGSKAQLVRTATFDARQRLEGRDWPPTAHTMVGLKRLDNLEHCLEEVIRNRVPGDVIECGVWRGGASIFARAVLKAYGIKDRTVWLADSFAGLPPPNVDKYPQDQGLKLHTYDELAVPLEQVQAHFDRYGLLDGQVRFLKGWFRDTLPSAPVRQLAVMRLDGDMYESTMDALTSLHPKLSPGGFVIIDDFQIPACAQAVHDYRRQHGITDEIVRIDWGGVYWQNHGAVQRAAA